MNMQHTHQANFIQPTDRQSLELLQARRRQLLGLVLVIIGSIWFGLRLFGWVGDLELPVVWQEATGEIVSYLNYEARADSGLLTACGMLITYTSHSTW